MVDIVYRDFNLINNFISIFSYTFLFTYKTILQFGLGSEDH